MIGADVVERREVSPLELFYDLVFAFAISQLSAHLLHDVTWRGAAETLVLPQDARRRLRQRRGAR